ncbi:vegetative incompatibility protein HET-E-1, putative [Rhizoctonia solani AG-3 Rhs1AP]|uniref:Vegetative incompatibility protein HET-E-1, putative n=1 Tax=Rhizoctonia solani AG-3 Rhs1AP TaxID=1086054 RepID=X8JDF0_9AGAM|nr:vegetative incompatibility protein HET-E-1, putative [Rhizoctonia solani AG-3 Rhs1AP]
MAIEHTLVDGLIVVIDALDELEDAVGAQTILKLVFENSTEVPVKFLITSRPDRGLLTEIMLQDNRILRVQHLHEVHKTKIQVNQPLEALYQQDMDVFYTSTLTEIFDGSNQNTEELNAIKLSLLWSAACIQKPLAVNSLARLLKLDERQAMSAWGPLQFVLDTLVGTRLITAPPASFLDFIFQ